MRCAIWGWTVWLVVLLVFPAQALPEDLVTDRGTRSDDVVLSWNAELLEADAADHAQAAPDQGGPTRASRAFAIVSVAMFDADNSISHDFRPYLTELRGYDRADRRAAMTAAAYHTLVALYPQQTEEFDEALDRWLDKIRRGESRTKGLELGRRVAQAILAERANDGSDDPGNYTPVDAPGRHRVDPNNPNQGFLGPAWGNVVPFVADDIDDFVPPPPPPLALARVRRRLRGGIPLGRRREHHESDDPLARADRDRHLLGLRRASRARHASALYNQIVRAIAIQKRNTSQQNNRLLALVNLAMADAGISCWRGKYLYDFWRPIVGIREGDDDGNDQTVGDPAVESAGCTAHQRPAGRPELHAPVPRLCFRTTPPSARLPCGR